MDAIIGVLRDLGEPHEVIILKTVKTIEPQPIATKKALAAYKVKKKEKKNSTPAKSKQESFNRVRKPVIF